MAQIPDFGKLKLGGKNTHINSAVVSPGAGMRSAGAGLGDLFNVFEQKKKEDDQLAYQRALLDLDAFGNNELNNPDTGYRNAKGDHALKEAGAVNQRYADKISEIRGGLKDNQFLDKFDLKTKDMQTAYIRQIMLHESQQQSALALQTMKSGIDVALNNAENLYSDSMSLMLGFNNLVLRIDEYTEQQGMPAEQRSAQKHELTQQYFSSALDGWIAHTEINRGSFSALAADMKKSLAFNKLTEINQAKYLMKIDSLAKKQKGEMQDGLSLDLANAWEMQKRGIEAPDIPLAAFNTVYGAKGKYAYDSYQDRQAMARHIGAMQGLPTSELLSYKQEDINSGGELSADTKNKHFADRLKIQAVRAEAAKILLKSREKDPINAAMQAGAIGDVELNQESLTKRFVQASRISKEYQTPLRIFSDKEAESVSDTVSNASASQQSELLNLLARSAGDDENAYNATLSEIGLQNPAIATAGHILNARGNSDYVIVKSNWLTSDATVSSKDTALLMLKGAEALKDKGKGDAKIKGVSLPQNSLAEFDKAVGNLFIDDAQAKQAAYSAAMAYYTGKAIVTGGYKDNNVLNTDLLNEAIAAAIGPESKKYNVRMPWGLNESTFEHHIETQYKRLIKENGWQETDNLKNFGYDPADTYAITQMSLSDRFQLIPSTYAGGLPDGKYFIQAGNGFLRDNKGDPVVLDVLAPFKKIDDIPE